ncbi:hypothetical protein OCU04_005738 [Sclerotinia nivalis]|uniref:Carrier domain-containing protein n=1 Tax=Sclerotinia nivalis TaxID=352851 RepID=A0A9X0AQK4_9HELO|nr:hypothetical protein OCU04_005738 [Sclerotinia nivalis]
MLPVGILFGQGVNYVIAQAAVLYAGGTCLLLDAGQSDQQIEEKLKQLGNVRVATDVDNQCRESLSNYPILLIRFEDSREVDQCVETLSKVPVWTSAEHRSHLIYTSGTTGQPKAVQLAAGGIIRLRNDPKIPISAAQDRVGQISHTGFDGAIFDVWVPLLNGATIVIIHQEIFLDPFAFEKYICQYRVTVFLITTSLFNILAFASPRIFSKMNVVICGGEAANPRAMELVLKHGPPKYLYNGYGPSECSVLTTLHAVTIEDTKGETISIGTPFAGSEVYLLDDSMREVAPGEIGEMFIGGSGLSKGYCNQPESNTSRYLQLDGLGHRPMSLYRTGDICSKDEAGNIFFVRRRDHQVKFNGFQVDLQSIDSAVLATGFAQAAVTLMIEQSQDVGPLLVTWITPRSNLTNTECLGHLQTLIQKLLPRGVLPRIEIVQEFPLNSSLKIDRNRLKEAYLKKLRLLQANFDSLSAQKKVAMETRLEKIWRDIFSPEKSLDMEESLFTVGGTSLQVPLLISKIFSEFGTKLSAKVVYENPTLNGLAHSIRAIEQGHLPKSNVTDLLLADASLLCGLKPYDISSSVPN